MFCVVGIFPQLVNVLRAHGFNTHFPAILCLFLLSAYVEDEAGNEKWLQSDVYEEHTAC